MVNKTNNVALGAAEKVGKDHYYLRLSVRAGSGRYNLVGTFEARCKGAAYRALEAAANLVRDLRPDELHYLYHMMCGEY